MARLFLLAACTGPVAGFHEHIAHHIGGLLGGGGGEEGAAPEPRYLYDELGNVLPFNPKDQHGKPPHACHGRARPDGSCR
jgi:hypothetical protein